MTKSVKYWRTKYILYLSPNFYLLFFSLSLHLFFCCLYKSLSLLSLINLILLHLSCSLSFSLKIWISFIAVTMRFKSNSAFFSKKSRLQSNTEASIFRSRTWKNLCGFQLIVFRYNSISDGKSSFLSAFFVVGFIFLIKIRKPTYVEDFPLTTECPSILAHLHIVSHYIEWTSGMDLWSYGNVWRK